MDYFQGVVTEYLRANRATFVNTECLIQLDSGDAPAKGRHWYCDAVAVNFAERSVHLCEVSYSTTLYALLARLAGWSKNWPTLQQALCRDCGVPNDWRVRPWVFVPRDRETAFLGKVSQMTAAEGSITMPAPRVTYLEEVVPWKYKSWDRKLEALADQSGRAEAGAQP
jgi:hypothetical protein